MTDLCEARVRIVEYLTGVAPLDKQNAPIGEETELYYDLGLYGDDLFEMTIWMEKEFGMEPTGYMLRRAPPESFMPPFSDILNWLYRRCLRRPKKRYGSLKVRDVINAAAAGSWPDHQEQAPQ